jgi:2-amino-4-hydroxy-6-hydroxymethyldihydropteridine diphosphokinase
LDGRKRKNIAYLSVGSNLGDKVKNCLEAIDEVLKAEENELIDKSSLYRTEPWGNQDQDWFVNAVFKIRTSFDPEGLLKHLRNVEDGLKKKKEERWGPRNIDLDILLFNDEIIETTNLTIPHPFLHLRRFVLVPLKEVCPDLIHPQLKLSITELLRRTGDEKEVIPFSEERPCVT